MSVSESSSSSTVIPTLAEISSSLGARPTSPQPGDRALDLACARANRAGHPVERAELVDDRAADARDRVGLELDVAVEVEALDRPDQPEQPVRDEVAFVDVRRQARPEPPGDVLHERRVHDDQPVAQHLVVRAPVLQPDAPGVYLRGHGKRIRASAAFSSARPSPSRPSRPAIAAAATAITQPGSRPRPPRRPRSRRRRG